MRIFFITMVSGLAAPRASLTRDMKGVTKGTGLVPAGTDRGSVDKVKTITRLSSGVRMHPD